MQQRETELQRPRTQLGLQKVTNAIQSGSPILSTGLTGISPRHR
jgi:hypothetical protein